MSEVKETEVCGLIAGFMMSYGISPEKLCYQLCLLSGSFRSEFSMVLCLVFLVVCLFVPSSQSQPRNLGNRGTRFQLSIIV